MTRTTQQVVPAIAFATIFSATATVWAVPSTQYIQFNEAGTITQVGAAAVEIKTDRGMKMVVHLNPQTAIRGSGPVQIQVNGKLSPKGLDAGLAVQFQAVLDDSGNAVGEVAKMAVSTTTKRIRVAPKPVNDPELPEGTMLIAGSITKYEDGVMTVSTKTGLIDATVSKFAEIEVEGISPKLVKAGDKIYARGVAVSPSQRAPVYYAQFVSIDLADPIETLTPPK